MFLPSAVRVAGHAADVGSAGKGPVLGYTGHEQHVTVDLEAAKQDLAVEGQAVTVTLPDGTELGGEVAEVSATVASAPAEDGGGQEDEAESTVEVTVAVDDPEAVAGLESAPVKVELVAETREDVLVVPVEALLALREGGYAVELVEGDSVELVPVETGMFAGGLVEVSGEGLAEGALVGVPE